jgi:hypothetical protein
MRKKREMMLTTPDTDKAFKLAARLFTRGSHRDHPLDGRVQEEACV